MIRIGPTTDSGLSWADYGVDLPEGGGLNLNFPRPMKKARTLDGSSVVTAWPKKISGHQTSVEVAIPEATFQTLRTLDEHQTVTEWLLITEDRTFRVVLDVNPGRRVRRYQSPYRLVTVTFTIVREL